MITFLPLPMHPNTLASRRRENKWGNEEILQQEIAKYEFRIRSHYLA